MPDPSWSSSPPEANYLRLVGSGATGTATTLASAAAWQALMAGNEVAFAASTLNAATTAVSFEGLGGAGSTASATALNTSLQLLAGWVQEKPPILTSAVAAYETAVSSMIPAEVSLSNRTSQASDVAINPLVLGALTPAIVALDVEYFGEHWPHNASAGAAYGSALAALIPALTVPPPPAPPGMSPEAPATAAEAVAQTAGESAAGQAMKESGEAARLATEATAAPPDGIGQAAQAASTLLQPLQSAVQPLSAVSGMFSTPMQALQGLSGLPQSLAGQFGAASPRDAEVPLGMLASVSGPGPEVAGGAAVGGPSLSGTGGVGGVPGATATSYTRPTSSFAPEVRGRPVGLTTGLLSAAGLRPASTTGGGPVPISPARSGSTAASKGEVGEMAPRARIVVPEDGGPQH